MSDPFPPFYRRLRAAIADRRAAWVLGAASVAESIVSPLPPDFLLAPMVVARPDRAFHLALLTTITSVLGGVGGYLIGAFFMDYIGWRLVDFYHLRDSFETLSVWIREYGVAIVLIGALSPIPYKAITIMSGIALFNPLAFILLSLIGRGGRFFAVAFICKLWGAQAEAFLLKQLMQSKLRSIVSLTFVSALLVILGAWLFEYVKGLEPCVLCLWQRWPYYLVIGFCFSALLSFSEKIYFWVLSLSCGILLVGALLAGYHLGIEWGIFQGFTGCRSTQIMPHSTQELLSQLSSKPIADCSTPAWKLFGLSLAAYNMIISLLLSGYIFWKITYGQRDRQKDRQRDHG